MASTVPQGKITMQVQSSADPGSRAPFMPRIIAALAASLACAAWLPASAATLDRIQQSGQIKLGYLDDARPFSDRNEAVIQKVMALTCVNQVVERVKTQLSLPQLSVDWVPIRFEDRWNRCNRATSTCSARRSARPWRGDSKSRSRSQCFLAASGRCCARMREGAEGGAQ